MKYLLLLLLFLAACTPQYRLNRLKEKHPELFKTDTVVIRDTLIIENAFLDTLFIPGSDTVIFKEGKLRIKHHYDTITRKVFLQGECETDTFYREVKVPIEKAVIVEGKSKTPWWVWVIVGVMGLMIGGLIFLRR